MSYQINVERKICESENVSFDGKRKQKDEIKYNRSGTILSKTCLKLG